MGAPELQETIFEVVQTGSKLGEPAKIIQLTSDNGVRTWSVVEQTAKTSNGAGVNYWVAAAISLIEGVRYAVSSGAMM